jgi:peptidoglycan hydrolase-like protein with peptidoglycan-binding domain
MAIALLPVALGGGAAYLLYQYFFPPKPQLQSLRRIDGTGTPVQVVVPVTKTKPVIGRAIAPVPPGNIPTPHVAPTVTTPSPPPIPATYSPPPRIELPQVLTSTGNSTLTVSSNQDVQRALNTLGMATPPLVVDGQIGPKSQAAIRSFQSQHGLTVDGIAGPQTKTALQAALGGLAATGSDIGTNSVVQNAATVAPPLDLTSGVTVSTNKDVQHALNLLGASPILVEDGAIGPKSIAAIKAFQISHGLVADGVAGPKTKAALALALAPQPSIVAGMAGEGDLGGVHSSSKKDKKLTHLT